MSNKETAVQEDGTMSDRHSETMMSSCMDSLHDILRQPEERILPLLLSGNKAAADDDEAGITEDARTETVQELLRIAKDLFRDIDVLGEQYSSLSSGSSSSNRKRKHPTDDGTDDNNNNSHHLSETSFSGLSELFLPPNLLPTNEDLPETIHGQVELQNAAMMKVVRKAAKRLGKSCGDIRLLELEGEEDEVDENDEKEEEEQDENLLLGDDDDAMNQGANDSSSSTSKQQYDDDDDATESSETERIRERMQRAMEDMEEEEGEDDNDEEEEDEHTNSHSETKKSSNEKENDLYDPVAEDMKDGFFDLNEMEDFADEEEDFLPQEVTEPPSSKGTKRHKGPYARESDDDESLEDSENDESDRSLEGIMPGNKRKKYREQEDIDALYSLYGTKPSHDDVEDRKNDVENMTAADFFGVPNRNLIDRYKKKHKGINADVVIGDDNKDETDSWGDYDFEKEDGNGWNQDHDGGDDDEDATESNQLDDENPMHERDERPSDGTTRKGGKQDKLQRQTEELENELLAEKPWKMIGESKAFSRPINSLLESTPEFDMAGKQAPVITVEHTMDLEEVIKKRILAEDWDDDVPRELPDIGQKALKGQAPEVSQEKSKLGLGELYEREYLLKTTGYDKDGAEKLSEMDKAKEEMKSLFANLCSKLDALSNYHFAPRPLADEADVQPIATPAIAMEEVLPLHVSDARTAAPEQVFAPKRGKEGLLQSTDEMEASERKRLRQTKKANRRKARKEKQADQKLISRLQPGLGLNNPYERRKAEEELRTARSQGRLVDGEEGTTARFGSSGTFFSKLQVESQATENIVEASSKRKASGSSSFKLG